MSKFNKRQFLFSVKIRLKSNEPYTIYKPAIKQGVVFSASSKLAEIKAIDEINRKLRQENGYAELISISKIRQDFVFKTEE